MNDQSIRTEELVKEITKLKAEVSNLKKENSQFRTITEYASDNIAIVTFDLKATYLFVNPSIKNTLGYEREELLGRSFFDFIHPDDKKALFPLLKSYVKNKAKDLFQKGNTPITETIEFRFKNKIGNWQHMQSTINVAGKNLLAVTRDVTDNKYIVDTLKESENRFRTMFEDHDAIMLLIEPDSGKIVNANRSAEKYYGYSNAELRNKLIDDINVLSTEEVAESRNQAKMKEVSFFNFKHRLKNGEIRDVEVHSTPIKFMNQTLLFSIIHDVTKSMKSENDLIENKKLLEKIAENYPNSYVSIIEKDLTCGFTSGQEFKKLGLNPNDFIGLPLKDVFGEHEPVVKKYYLNTFAGEEQEFELFINEQYQLYKTVPLLDDDGMVERILAVVENVTNQKRYEIELRDSENRLAAVFNNTSDLQLLVNRSSDNEFSIVSVNRTYLNTANQFGLNLKKEDLIGRTIEDVCLNILGLNQKVTDYTLNNYIRAATTNERINYFESIVVNKKLFHSEVTLSPILDSLGNCQYVLYNSHDVTTIKQSEILLQQSEEKFRGIYDQSPIAIEIYNKDGKLIDVNQETMKLFGVADKKYVLGFDLWADPNLTSDKMKKLKNGEAIYISTDFDFELVKEHDLYPTNRSGKMYLDMYSIPLKNEKEITGYLVQILEVTERKDAELALMQSEIKYQNQANFLDSVIESSPFAMWISDAKGILIRANQALRNILNLSDDMLIEKYNVLHDENLNSQGFMPVVEAVFNDLKSTRFTLFWTGAEAGDVDLSSANDLWIDVSMFPIIDEAGKLVNVVCQYVDITEQKKAKEAILHSTMLLRNSQKLAKIGNWSMDLISDEATWSNEVLEIYGRSKKNGVPSAEEWKDIIHEDDWERLNLHIQQVKLGESEYNIAYRIKRADNGQIRYIHSLGEIVYENNIPIRLIGVDQDVTERKQAEEEIRESEERFRELVDTINSGVAIYKVINDGKSGNDYIIQDFNEFSLKHENMEKSDVIGKSLKDIRPNIDDYGLIDTFHNVWKTGTPAFFPVNVYVDDKYSNFYENRVFRLSSGEIVAIYDDVTVRERAAEKIKESQQRFDLAMKASKDGLFDWNLITNEIYYSPGWKSMLGYEYDELPNDFSVWEKLTAPEDVKRSWEMIEKVTYKKRDRFEMEFKMKHKEGHWVDILSRAEAIFDEFGQALRMIGTHVDITERKKAEEELKKHRDHLEELVKERTKELETKNKRLEDFNKLFVGREFRIKELRMKVKELEKKLGDFNEFCL
jgi:PAS domain S-box-containing protein